MGWGGGVIGGLVWNNIYYMFYMVGKLEKFYGMVCKMFFFLNWERVVLIVE